MPPAARWGSPRCSATGQRGPERLPGRQLPRPRCRSGNAPPPARSGAGPWNRPASSARIRQARPGNRRPAQIRRIRERCPAEDPLRPVTSPRANPTAASGCHLPGGSPGTTATQQPGQPAGRRRQRRDRAVNRPVQPGNPGGAPQRRRTVPSANEDRLAGWWRRIMISAVFHVSSRWDSRSHENTRAVKRKANRRHMIGDHHGWIAGRATLPVRAVDGILGTRRARQRRGIRGRTSGCAATGTRGRLAWRAAATRPSGAVGPLARGPLARHARFSAGPWAWHARFGAAGGRVRLRGSRRHPACARSGRAGNLPGARTAGSRR